MIDLFNKHIPEGAPEKDGINILLLSDYNIAGHYTYLMRAINKYSPHKARCIIWHDDQFQYDQDIILDKLADYTEPSELVAQADFFFFGRVVFGWEKDGKKINFQDILTPNNCLLKYHGSFLRENYGKYNLKDWHLTTKLSALTGLDWTIVPKLAGSFYHIHGFFSDFGDMDYDDIPRSAAVTDVNPEQVRIYAGSGGHSEKQYKFLHETIKRLQDEGYDVSCETTSQLKHEDFILEKAKAHLCFSSLFGGGWGLSGVESMFMGQPVLCTVDPWILSQYPDAPCIWIDKNTLYDRIKELLNDKRKIRKASIKHRVFAARYFRTKTILARYLYLIDLIRNQDAYELGHEPVPRIYDLEDL